jgi:hypothetical protein
LQEGIDVELRSKRKTGLDQTCGLALGVAVHGQNLSGLPTRGSFL